jgi:hypothetical protein
MNGKRETMTDLNSEYDALEAKIEGRICAKCRVKPWLRLQLRESADSKSMRFETACNCTTAPILSSRETQAQFIRHKEQGMQEMLVPILSDEEVAEANRDFFGKE